MLAKKIIPPLLIAFHNQNFDLAKLLIENGMDINVTDYRGKTPLHFAVDQNKTSIIKWLIDKGSNVNAGSGLEIGPPIISIFINTSYTIEVVKSVLERIRKDIYIEGSIENMNSVDFTCKYHPYAETIKILIEAGADLKARRNNNYTAQSYFDDFKNNVLYKLESQK